MQTRQEKYSKERLARENKRILHIRRFGKICENCQEKTAACLSITDKGVLCQNCLAQPSKNSRREGQLNQLREVHGSMCSVCAYVERACALHFPANIRVYTDISLGRAKTLVSGQTLTCANCLAKRRYESITQASACGTEMVVGIAKSTK